MAKLFQRKIEDFKCENCGFDVIGNGYTNHCPKCLWSKHVDINPGDRAESCGGLMKPVSVLKKGGNYVLSHLCIKCSLKRPVNSAKDDDFDAIVGILDSC